MDSGKRSKNFTEREKMLLIEVAKDFVTIIDNKKTDGPTVEAKKQAWLALTNKFNAVAETGLRTEKQLHALYDNLKKKARRNMSDDKSETYEPGVRGTFCQSKTAIDEKVVALMTPRFQPLSNECNISAPYYKIEQQESSNDIVSEAEEDLVPDVPSTSNPIESNKRPLSLLGNTPQTKKVCLNATKRKFINSFSDSINRRKNINQNYEDKITLKKLEIIEIQKQQELLKLEKTKTILSLDIELKQVLLENAKIDLEFKKKLFNL